MARSKYDFTDSIVMEGPGQKDFEDRIFEGERTKSFPRMPKGMGRFEGQVAIVTGAAGGQGEMEAKLLAQEGATVFVADVNTAEAQRVADHINADGGAAIAVFLDVADEEQWRGIAKSAFDTYGSLDVLVNNAGIVHNGSVLTEDRSSMEELMDVDCWGVYNGMHHCAPYMIESGGGSIVNTCSFQGAKLGPKGLIAYSMAKAAVLGATRAAASDLAEYGIRVNTVNPGHVLTPMTHARPENRRMLIEATMLKRFALAEEIARPVVFLASDDASFITGQELYVDGGLTTFFHMPSADKKAQ